MRNVVQTLGTADESVCRHRPGGLTREDRAIFASRRAWCWTLAVLGVGLALAGAGMLFSDRSGSAAFAQMNAATARSEGLVVSTTALGDNEAIICLVDTSQQRLLVYVADAKRSRLKLLAARDISADWSLTDWNNDPPLPKDIRTRADKALEGARPAPGAGAEKKPDSTP